MEFRNVEDPFEVGIDNRDVGVGALLERSFGDSQYFRGIERSLFDELRPAKEPRFDERLENERERGLQSDDSEGRDVDFALLFLLSVGRVIGRDRVDRSVDQSFDTGGDVIRAAEGPRR